MIGIIDVFMRLAFIGLLGIILFKFLAAFV